MAPPPGPRKLLFLERLDRMPVRPEPTAEERERDRQIELERQAAQANMARASRRHAVTLNVGARYATASLESFIATTDEQRAVLGDVRAYCDQIAANVASGSGLVLIGPPGTGKDHLAAAVLYRAADAGFKTRWVNGMEIFSSARDLIGGDAHDAEARWLAKFVDADVLAISDPIPPAGVVAEGWQISKLFQIVDGRYRAMRPTVITINVADPKEAAARMSANIAERLIHGSLVLRCNWQSFRKPKL